MKLRVEVTAEDIRKGVKDDTCKCPVARALKRIFPGSPVEVGVTYVSIRGVVAAAPRSVRRFVDRFDMGKRVRPAVFVIDTDKRHLP